MALVRPRNVWSICRTPRLHAFSGNCSPGRPLRTVTGAPPLRTAPRWHAGRPASSIEFRSGLPETGPTAGRPAAAQTHGSGEFLSDRRERKARQRRHAVRTCRALRRTPETVCAAHVRNARCAARGPAGAPFRTTGQPARRRTARPPRRRTRERDRGAGRGRKSGYGESRTAGRLGPRPERRTARRRSGRRRRYGPADLVVDLAGRQPEAARRGHLPRSRRNNNAGRPGGPWAPAAGRGGPAGLPARRLLQGLRSGGPGVHRRGLRHRALGPADRRPPLPGLGRLSRFDGAKDKGRETCRNAQLAAAATTYNLLQRNAYPSSSSWDNGDRRVDCYVTADAGNVIMETLVP